MCLRRVHALLACRTSVAEIIDDHFGGTKDFVAAAVTPLEDLEDGVVWLGCVVAHAEGFVAMGVEGLAEAVFGLDTVVTQKLVQLLEGYLHAPGAVAATSTDRWRARIRDCR